MKIGPSTDSPFVRRPLSFVPSSVVRSEPGGGRTCRPTHTTDEGRGTMDRESDRGRTERVPGRPARRVRERVGRHPEPRPAGRRGGRVRPAHFRPARPGRRPAGVADGAGPMVFSPLSPKGRGAGGGGG